MLLDVGYVKQAGKQTFKGEPERTVGRGRPVGWSRRRSIGIGTRNHKSWARDELARRSKSCGVCVQSGSQSAPRNPAKPLRGAPPSWPATHKTKYSEVPKELEVGLLETGSGSPLGFAPPQIRYIPAKVLKSSCIGSIAIQSIGSFATSLNPHKH